MFYILINLTLEEIARSYENINNIRGIYSITYYLNGGESYSQYEGNFIMKNLYEINYEVKVITFKEQFKKYVNGIISVKYEKVNIDIPDINYRDVLIPNEEREDHGVKYKITNIEFFNPYALLHFLSGFSDKEYKIEDKGEYIKVRIELKGGYKVYEFIIDAENYYIKSLMFWTMSIPLAKVEFLY